MPLSGSGIAVQRWGPVSPFHRHARNTNPNPLAAGIVLPFAASHTEQSIDLPGGGPNRQTHSTTTQAGDIVVAWFQTEFPDPGTTPGAQYRPRASHNGKLGRQIFALDGYSGAAGNKGFRCWVWANPDIGTFNTALWLDDGTGTDLAIANELASVVIVFRAVAPLILPIRMGNIDVSTSNRSGDGPFLVPSATNETVIHGMNCSVNGTGTLGSGETLIADSAPATDISRIIVSRKNGATGTVGVSSSGYTGTLGHPFQGMGMSLQPIGTTETRIRALFDIAGSANQTPLSFSGAWSTPPSARTTAMNLVSGKLQGSTAGENMAICTTPTFGTDGGIRARIAAGFSAFCWIAVRCAGSGSSSCYKLDVLSLGSGLRLEKMIDTGASLTYTSLHADYGAAGANIRATDLIELWITGGNLEVYYNQTLVDTVADGTLTVGGFGTGVFGTGTSFDEIEIISGPRPRYP